MKPELSHYYGRRVTQVRSDEENPWAWMIELEGDVLIKNTDQRRTSIPDIAGLTLNSSTETDGSLDLDFSGQVDITMTTTQMEISAPGVSDAEEEDDMLPPDPSPDRVAEGPSNVSQEEE